MIKQYIVNKMSLNRNTDETKLCIDWLIKLLCPEIHRNIIWIFPRSNGSLFANSMFLVTSRAKQL